LAHDLVEPDVGGLLRLVEDIEARGTHVEQKRAQSQAIELPGSHAIFLSHAHEVAALIEKAAMAAK
jgi:hypothetical protein